MSEPEIIRDAILKRLLKVVDPETGADVIRMRLIDELGVDESGHASYIFRPSSPLCPIAVSLAQTIKNAVREVPGVTGQTITVRDYIQARALTELLNFMP